MSGKLKGLLSSCLGFWKEFATSQNKKDFLKLNQNRFKTQIIILLSAMLTCFVVTRAMKPAVKGACRIILQSDDDGMGMRGNRIVGVEARKAISGTTRREVRSIGTLKANAEVVIRAEIPGKIKEIAFTEGAEVSAGDILIVFEDDLYKSEQAKHEAEYSLRKAEFERVKKLYEGKAGSQKAYDEALAQMNASKAQLDSTNFQLSKTVIKAPFDGTIGILKGSVSPGNIVQQHTEIVDIVDNSVVKVEFLVPARYIDNIAVGQNVELTVDAFGDKVFTGAVDAIDSEVDTKSHSILVRAAVPNRTGNLRHGMFANVKLVTGEKSGVVLVDEDALDREGAIEFVWVIDDKGRAYRKRVLTGSKDINGVEIIAGLRADEIVVVSGQLKLTDGSRTKILNTSEFTKEDLKRNKISENDDVDSDGIEVSEDDENDKEEHKSLVDQDPEKDSASESEGKKEEKSDEVSVENEKQEKTEEPGFFKRMMNKIFGKSEKVAAKSDDSKNVTEGDKENLEKKEEVAEKKDETASEEKSESETKESDTKESDTKKESDESTSSEKSEEQKDGGEG